MTSVLASVKHKLVNDGLFCMAQELIIFFKNVFKEL